MIERLRNSWHALRLQRFARTAVSSVPMVWLLLFFLVPFLIVLKISFSEALLAMPPYAPLLAWTHERVLSIQLHLANYHFLFSDALYLDSFLYSLKVAAVSTALCLLLGFPLAMVYVRAPAWLQGTLI